MLSSRLGKHIDINCSSNLQTKTSNFDINDFDKMKKYENSQTFRPSNCDKAQAFQNTLLRTQVE